jgi:hypothetical protein
MRGSCFNDDYRCLARTMDMHALIITVISSCTQFKVLLIAINVTSVQTVARFEIDFNMHHVSNIYVVFDGT